MHKVKHNKIRNTGLLFEFLLRQITSDVLNKSDGKAVSIVKHRFNETTELGKELALYNILINKKFSDDKKYGGKDTFHNPKFGKNKIYVLKPQGFMNY